ncbi:ABC transporter permease [Clostridium celatum]|uniref:Putative spermidine/putrescine ABC transporter, permease protein PotB n=1 Tax=Clostridium celatum DSM 1785 TaxID=545697 RepID=L1QE92_9CLOT|nr:ABC transporter permease [Clostridium celatum]EKY26288.1 putative spermidine/putrescine ABC transporter, permease protein PotB [Clostridium celatum DSM 1785]MCE9653985.1 ABC transporter permease [Clostridium celatum]MDU2264981.1 ABC transporter permease [Clostridium celatum]MDU3722398.1 ABC transporter permease [Clostridium celatum]MDU6294341.1 ABC transporter permease [Clostridium celatum]
MKKKNSQGILPASPYIVWSSLFIVIPLLIVVFFSFTVKSGDNYKFSLENFQRLMDPIYLKVFWRSLVLAFKATIGCLILGYPVAYLVSKMREGKRNILIMLFIVPMWMNFLLRTYAWLPILGKNGLINTFFSNFGIGPFNILYNDFAVLLGMIYNFLPFMILPIYTVLIKMDNDLINAASDLGADRKHIFMKIILPLSMPGVISGITMVFMPAVSTFVISRILGGGQYMLLGNLIETQYTTMNDWNFGSAIAIFMMLIILLSMAFMNKFEGADDKEGGSSL